MDALNALCPYFTMFPLDFPRRVLAGAAPGSRVLDPFCGRGTTLFAARALGLPSLGVDSSPVATAVSRAKASAAPAADVTALASSLLSASGGGDAPPAGPFWSGAYHPEVLEALMRLRAGLSHSDGPAADALRGIVLGALHGPVPRTKHAYFSNQMPRTFAPKPASSVRFWEAHDLRAPRVDVLSVIAERAGRFYGCHHPSVPALALDGDARTFVAGGDPFDAVVTSPPYHGLKTYRQENWLRLWFLGGPALPDYGKEGQIGMGSLATFGREIGIAFANVARQCRAGARLAVRFGSIASHPCDPEAVLRGSLSGTGWEVERVVPADYTGAGQRITRQMGERTREAGRMGEIDLFATLGAVPC